MVNSPSKPAPTPASLGVVIVNYNTSALTLQCLQSIARVDVAMRRCVIVVDNSTDTAQQQALDSGITTLANLAVEVLRDGRNKGFAEACNIAIHRLPADTDISHVLLLNNDAVLCDGGLEAMWQAVTDSPDVGMVAARMHRADDPDRVDSLGIAMYLSALASNRMETDDRLIGPTGGLAIYSRDLLQSLQDQHGMIFDEDFFCYAEDTDLALRARLLGFRVAYVDHCAALHHGQASSGGAFNDFVLYHGIRNSIWVIVKDFPMSWLLLLSPLILLLHGGIVLRHGLAGRWTVLWRLYRDALKCMPLMWRRRAPIQRSRTLPWRDFGQLLTPRFYDRAYLRKAWHELWVRCRDGV